MAAASWNDLPHEDRGRTALRAGQRVPRLSDDGYQPRTKQSRATVLSIIVAIHVLAGLAVVSMKVAGYAPEPLPMEVVIVQPPPTSLPATPTPKVPLPTMKQPEIRLPTPPTVDVITVRLEEKPAPPPVAVAPVAVPVETPAAPKNDEPPRFGMAYLNNPAPVYPVMSRRGHEQGRVLLRVSVSAAGTVDAIEVQQSSGFPRLDQAALSTVQRWRFQPARSGNQPVPGKALVPIDFELN